MPEVGGNEILRRTGPGGPDHRRQRSC